MNVWCVQHCEKRVRVWSGFVFSRSCHCWLLGFLLSPFPSFSFLFFEIKNSGLCIVCPTNALAQTPYIAMKVSIAPVALHEKRCAWFPACKMTQKNCGGSRKDRCQYYRNRIIDKEFVAKVDKEKSLYDRERKKLIMRKKRKRNNTAATTF